MRKIGKQSIEDIAVGAAILGAGGGGDPYIGKLTALDAVEEYGPITLLDVQEVADEDLIIPIGFMGAPTVIVEKVPSGNEALMAFDMLERRLKRKAKATMPIEVGGINSTTPLVVGARLGIPVVDADGMGRAFPEIQMVTFNLERIPATPMAISDEKGNTALLETVDDFWAERVSRAITVVMGGSSVVAHYPLSGKELKRAAIPNTLTLAETIGKSIRRALRNKKNPIQEILKTVNGYKLFRGKIIDVARRTVAGFAQGEASLEGIEEYYGHELVIKFQNENLVVLKDGRILVSVPDLITTLDIETGFPVTTEGLKYGCRVVVTGFPCHSKWRTSKGLKIVGPRYFGYDIEYVPIEKKMKNA